MQKKNGTPPKRRRQKKRPAGASVPIEEFNTALLSAEETRRKLWVANVLLAALVAEAGGTLDITRDAIEALPEDWHLARETVDVDAVSGACAQRVTIVVGEDTSA